MGLINKSIGVIFVVLIFKMAYLAQTYTVFLLTFNLLCMSSNRNCLLSVVTQTYIDHMECSAFPSRAIILLHTPSLCAWGHKVVLCSPPPFGISSKCRCSKLRKSKTTQQPQQEKTTRQRAYATALLNGNLLPKAPKSRICFPRRTRALPHCSHPNPLINKMPGQAMFVLAERAARTARALWRAHSIMCHPEMKKKNDSIIILVFYKSKYITKR